MSAGFVHAVLFIAAWIGAGWSASIFGLLIQPEIAQQFIAAPMLADFVAMLAVFVAALIVLVDAHQRAVAARCRAAPLERRSTAPGRRVRRCCAAP